MNTLLVYECGFVLLLQEIAGNGVKKYTFKVYCYNHSACTMIYINWVSHSYNMKWLGNSVKSTLSTYCYTYSACTIMFNNGRWISCWIMEMNGYRNILSHQSVFIELDSKNTLSKVREGYIKDR